jgi:hypothetical protein
MTAIKRDTHITVPAAPAYRLLERFFEMLMAERQSAANTIDAYRRDLNDFAGFLGRRDRSLAEADAALVRYLQRLDQAGMAPLHGAARRPLGLRQFYKFLIGEGCGHDPPGTVDARGSQGAASKLAARRRWRGCYPQPAHCRAMTGCAPLRSWNCSTPPACGCRSWSACPSPP